VLTAGVHEFTHALVNYINGSLDENNYATPIWLNEGLAGYEASQKTADWRTRIAQRVAEGAIPLIDISVLLGAHCGSYRFRATMQCQVGKGFIVRCGLPTD
jgi:hypothetical protein